MDKFVDDVDVFENRRSLPDSALNNTEPTKDVVAIAENTLHGISRLDDDNNFQMFETRFLLEGNTTGRRRWKPKWKPKSLLEKSIRVVGTYFFGSKVGKAVSKKFRKFRKRRSELADSALADSELADLVNSTTLTKSVIMVGFEEDPRRRVGTF